MAAFKESQKRGAGPYTSNAMVGHQIRTGDPATDRKLDSKLEAKSAPRTRPGRPQSIAKNLDVNEGCCPEPAIGGTGGYKPITRGAGRRYEPL